MRLHSLFDPKRSATRSLVHYLKETRDYLPGIMGSTIQDPEITSLRKQINSQLTRAESFQPTLKSLKHARDEYYAHFGEKHFDKPEALLSDKPLPADDVVELIDFCKEVVSWHTANVFHCVERDWLEDDGKDELELLFCFVRRYLKMCDEVPKKLGSSELLEMITL